MHFQFLLQYPQLCSKCRALHLSEDDSADRGSTIRQPLPSVKYTPLFPLNFLLPSAGRRSTSSFMLNILSIYTIFALFFSDKSNSPCQPSTVIYATYCLLTKVSIENIIRYCQIRMTVDDNASSSVFWLQIL